MLYTIAEYTNPMFMRKVKDKEFYFHDDALVWFSEYVYTTIKKRFANIYRYVAYDRIGDHMYVLRGDDKEEILSELPNWFSYNGYYENVEMIIAYDPDDKYNVTDAFFVRLPNNLIVELMWD